jgi:hypothetical protein
MNNHDRRILQEVLTNDKPLLFVARFLNLDSDKTYKEKACKNTCQDNCDLTQYASQGRIMLAQVALHGEKGSNPGSEVITNPKAKQKWNDKQKKIHSVKCIAGSHILIFYSKYTKIKKTDHHKSSSLQWYPNIFFDDFPMI